MLEEKYQISSKATYLKLIVLRDELLEVERVLQKEITDITGLKERYRATRNSFLILKNVRDAIREARIGEPKDLVTRARDLRKRLDFSEHFRNKGIGHLDSTLLQRAVQWHPHIFHQEHRDDDDFKIMEAHKAIIEACANSFLDQNGAQKIFGTEIDLVYPPNAALFYSYLLELVDACAVWLDDAASSIKNQICWHENEKLIEMAAIAGQTDFDLNQNRADFSYSSEDAMRKVEKAIGAMRQMGVDEEVIKFLRDHLSSQKP